MNLREHAHQTQDMVPHIDTLQRLAAGAQRVNEFGVRTGVSTWALLDAMAPDGRLVSVDNGRCDKIPRRVREDDRWTFVAGDDLSPEVRRQLLVNPDVVFIDTDHEYHHTLAELALAAELGARLIVCHDWNLPDVADAVLGFCRRTRWYVAGTEPSAWGLVWLA